MRTTLQFSRRQLIIPIHHRNGNGVSRQVMKWIMENFYVSGMVVEGEIFFSFHSFLQWIIIVYTKSYRNHIWRKQDVNISDFSLVSHRYLITAQKFMCQMKKNQYSAIGPDVIQRFERDGRWLLICKTTIVMKSHWKMRLSVGEKVSFS